jgi:DNA recombination protein RmuC
VEVIVVILAGLVLLGLIGLAVQSWSAGQRREIRQDLAATGQAMEQRLQGIDQRFNQRLDTIQVSLGQSMSSTTETIGRIHEQLGALGKSAERILEVGQDIASLQDLLQPPRLRGGFGELLLERLLEQVVPGAYALQHRFRGGEAVDAVIRLGAGLVPVDSKFPLEGFNRLAAADTDDDRRRLRREFSRSARFHVDAVAGYIRCDEGTLDFALMYIPAERVFYELATSDGEEPGGELFTHAQQRRVFPVSPATMYIYLTSIALGLRGLRVEERAREVIDHLDRLTLEFGRFLREFEVLGGHIDNSKKKYDTLSLQAARFSDRMALSHVSDAGPDGNGHPRLLGEKGLQADLEG